MMGNTKPKCNCNHDQGVFMSTLTYQQILQKYLPIFDAHLGVTELPRLTMAVFIQYV